MTISRIHRVGGLVGQIDSQRTFQDVGAKTKNGFVEYEFCFVAISATKHSGIKNTSNFNE
jgi:hypothetical protein